MSSKQPKHKPGIHLFKQHHWCKPGKNGNNKEEWYWHIVSRNGRVIARSSESYTRKGNAVKSIHVVANLFYVQFQENGICAYYDHSKPDSPLTSYL
jgi:uncharacterized protein YegP (UPF0339 family)